MDKNNKKLLTLVYLILSALIAFSVGQLLSAVASIVPVSSAFLNLDIVQHGLPVVCGLVAFLIFQLHKGSNAYCDEVVTEIKKIVWPSRKDTTAMTIVVCIMVLIAGFMLAVFDMASGYMVTQLATIPLP